MKPYLFALALVCSMAASSHAAVPVIGKGDGTRFDTSRLSPQMQANYEVMKEKCTKCHSLERVAIPFVTGVAPITGQQFDVDVMKSTLFSMVRKANNKNVTISKDEAKAIASLLNYLIHESVR